ncbi:MAG: Urease accessory protein UreE [Rhodospirillales bacterium]
MRRAVRVIAAGEWPENAAVGQVSLVFDDRHRRRLRLLDDAGRPFLLDLDVPARLRDGDGLALEDGGYIRVCAAAEAVADVAPGDAAAAARLAWHIGNRHAALQVLPDGALRIRDDPVLVGMLEGLGAVVVRHHAPFAPEPGAYEAHPAGHARRTLPVDDTHR